MKNKKLKKRMYTIIEDIQEAHLEVGGDFIRKSKIENMKVKDLLKLLLPNGIDFSITVDDSNIPQEKESSEGTSESITDLGDLGVLHYMRERL